MLYVKESHRAVDDVCERLQGAVVANKMGVLGVHDLREKMKDKGVDFPSECRIFEVCNPMQAKRVLEKDMSISTALPCRISVYEEGRKVRVATLKPTSLLSLFGDAGLDSVARDVEETIVRIIDAACE